MATWVPQFDHIFRLLERVRQGQQANCYYARCPAHDDQRPSLSIKVDGDDLLVHCNRNGGLGCSFTEIRNALSIRAGCPVLLRPWGEVPQMKNHAPKRASKPEAIYDYCTADGLLAYQVLRHRRPDGAKNFSQRRPGPDGKWIWNLDGVQPILYRLPDLIHSLEDRPDRWVFCAEGEKDVDSLRRDNFTATCNSGGAGKFHRTDREPLRDARIAVLYDLDDIDHEHGLVVGFQHALNVVTSLWGIAREIRLVRLPVEPGGGLDYSDWRHSLAATIGPAKIHRILSTLLAAAPSWSPWGPNLEEFSRVRRTLS